MKKIKTKNIKQVVTFRAPPKDIYALLMDSGKHAMFTGSKAKISPRVNGKISAFDGWIEGKNLKLIPNHLIIQAWRGADWPKGHYSKAMFLLTKSKTGTKLTFGQTGVPQAKYAGINTGWKTQYWLKMKTYLARRQK